MAVDAKKRESMMRELVSPLPILRPRKRRLITDAADKVDEVKALPPENNPRHGFHPPPPDARSSVSPLHLQIPLLLKLFHPKLLLNPMLHLHLKMLHNLRTM